MRTPFINRAIIRNYKSIAACDVNLNSLVFLVGRNGAGKSNFLDALRFVADSLRTSLDHALRDRGTIKEVRRRSGGHPNHFAIRLNFTLPDERRGHYSFRVGAKPAGGFEVQEEECDIELSKNSGKEAYYSIKSGKIVSSTISPLPATLPDRLLLVAASGLPEFRPVYDALSGMEIYNLNPREIALMQKPDPGDLLRRDGGNAASVLQKLDKKTQNRINTYLSQVVPELTSAESTTLGSQETIEFRQAVKGQDHPWRFLASSMSDGTLRAFGILLAISQATSDKSERKHPLLIGLEEPEMALHPAASSVLLAALRDASENVQILVTSHSPDLLDNADIQADSLLAVENDEGLTRIGQIDQAGRKMLREKLFTAGELLRQDQIAPDIDAIADVSTETQLRLFDLDGEQK